MPLTSAQLTTLKADVAANANTVTYLGSPTAISAVPNTGDGNAAIAAWYNGTAAPAYKVYRTSVPMAEIMLNGFDWTRVDNLSAGKARIWEWMVEADPARRSIDPSKPNVRAGINAVWVGTAADLAVRAAVYLHCARDASRAEKLFAAGPGAAPDQSGDGPGTTALSSPITGDDVEAARNS